ncbi:MAG: hypothetical protein JWO82_3859 [Akkermansiaceae bacterium]|nr:hypothetical protein [Akkermansiaceae bacterium]
MMSGKSRFALLANPGSRRALGFAAACRSQGFDALRVIPWEHWLAADFDPAEALRGVDCLRIETPAEAAAVERLLLARGAAECRREGKYPILAEEDCARLAADEGELRYQRQWYLGWGQVLRGIGESCQRLGLRAMNNPGEVAALFDKEATRRILGERGVPVPEGGWICDGFDELVTAMDGRVWDRVFLKPCHGSSASGVMAISRNRRGGWRAVSSAVVDESGGEVRVFNSKRLRRIDGEAAVRATVDAVGRQRALMERWFPKATLAGRSFDLRVVVIAGEAAHIAVRTSRQPVTNLHLHNTRGELQAVRDSLGPERWARAMGVAVAAAAAFPGCHYCGVDLMIGAGGRSFAIAEVNAFGDLLHRERWQGLDPWEAELKRWPG